MSSLTAPARRAFRLPAVAERGWVFLTQDAHIRYRSAEAEALREAGLGAFVVITANPTAERTVEILEKARVEIERVAREETPPYIPPVVRGYSREYVHRITKRARHMRPAP